MKYLLWVLSSVATFSAFTFALSCWNTSNKVIDNDTDSTTIIWELVSKECNNLENQFGKNCLLSFSQIESLYWNSSLEMIKLSYQTSLHWIWCWSLTEWEKYILKHKDWKLGFGTCNCRYTALSKYSEIELWLLRNNLLGPVYKITKNALKYIGMINQILAILFTLSLFIWIFNYAYNKINKHKNSNKKVVIILKFIFILFLLNQLISYIIPQIIVI